MFILFYFKLFVIYNFLHDFYKIIKKLIFGDTERRIGKINEMLIKMRKNLRRSQKDLPPNYPNAWAGVLLSHQLKPNKVKAFIAFGRELIASRDRLGRIHVIDAFCPHFTDNKYYFGSDGSHDSIKCSINDCSISLKGFENIKFSDEITSLFNNGKPRLWHIYECNEIIYVWHHNELKKPNWYPTKLEEKFTLSTSSKIFSYALVQDVFENSADMSHFHTVHGGFFEVGNINLRNFLAYIFHTKFEHGWSLGKENSKASFSLIIKPTILGKIMFTLPVQVESDGQTSFNERFKLFGKEYICYLFAVPIHLDRLCMNAVAYSDSTLFSRVVTYLICRFNDKNLRDDYPILRHKRYYRTPLYTKFDKTIIEYRKWCQQFYSD